MNGDNNYIIDTNILIYYFEGRISLDFIFKKATFIGISIVSYIEFLGYPKLTKSDISKFDAFIKLITVMELPKFHSHSDFYDLIISIKRNYKIKLPDSLIVAQAISNNCILISNDLQLLNIKNLKSLSL